MIINHFDYLKWSYCVPIGSGLMAYDMSLNATWNAHELHCAIRELSSFSNYLLEGIKALSIPFAEIEIIRNTAGLYERVSVDQIGIDPFTELLETAQQQYANQELERITFRIDEYFCATAICKDNYLPVA